MVSLHKTATPQKGKVQRRPGLLLVCIFDTLWKNLSPSAHMEPSPFPSSARKPVLGKIAEIAENPPPPFPHPPPPTDQAGPLRVH